MPVPAFLAPAIISGISAIGGLLGNRKKTTTQDQTRTERGTVSTTANIFDRQVQTPDLDPATQDYLNLIRQRYTGLLDQDPDLGGYAATGIGNINRAGDLRSRSIQNILAARGLSYSPMAAGALAGGESSRVSDVVNFQNQIPLLRDKLMRDRLNEAAAFFSKIPLGQTSETTGTRTGTETRDVTTTGTGSTTDPGNRAAGLFGGLGSTLAYLYGSGAFSNNPVTNRRNPNPYGPVYPGVSGG